MAEYHHYGWNGPTGPWFNHLSISRIPFAPVIRAAEPLGVAMQGVFAEDQQVIQALAANGPGHAFDVGALYRAGVSPVSFGIGQSWGFSCLVDGNSKRWWPSSQMARSEATRTVMSAEGWRARMRLASSMAFSTPSPR